MKLNSKILVGLVLLMWLVSEFGQRKPLELPVSAALVWQ